MAITRLTGGLTPADGSDPRTFPTIFNGAADAVEALEALNPVAFGTAVASVGDALVYDGDEWQPHVPSENVVINGAMQVHQRGTSVAGANGYATADRWLLGINDFGTWTQSIEADGPTGSGFTKSLKMLCTVAQASPSSASTILFQQRFEGQNLQVFAKGTTQAKEFAVSFWAKSNVTGTYIAEITDADNDRSVSATYQINVSNTWERKTIIFPADATGAFDNDGNFSGRVVFWLGAGSNFTSGTLATAWGATVPANRVVGQTNLGAATDNYWQVTGVQLEAGSVATPFQFEDVGTTLAKCQRYYQRAVGEEGSVAAAAMYGGATNTNICELLYFPPVQFRTAPTSIIYSGMQIQDVLGGVITALTSIAIDAAVTSRNCVGIAVTKSGSFTAGNAARLLKTVIGDSIAFSAEL